MLKPSPNPFKEGDRVRVSDRGPEDMVGRVGTVIDADPWCLGDNDFNTSVDLDGWDKSLGQPIFSSAWLEKE